MASRQMVVFKVNNEEFGIDISQVNIIEKMMEIFKVPNVPEYVEGLINLRGKVHTVINLRKRFNLPAKEYDENTKIIIVNVNSTMAGLIVDEVFEIVTFEDTEIECTPQVIAELDKKFMSGVAKKENKIVIIVDLESLVFASMDNYKSAAAN